MTLSHLKIPIVEGARTTTMQSVEITHGERAGELYALVLEGDCIVVEVGRHRPVRYLLEVADIVDGVMREHRS